MTDAQKIEALTELVQELVVRVEKLEDKVDELNPNPRWSLD
jgi:outer membrane murein-binding lipoprotein Lpp